MQPIRRRDDLEELSRAWQASRVLLTGVELDLFSRTVRPVTPAEAAADLGTAPRHTARLMAALAALGLLERRGERFINTPVADTHLVPGRPGYLGGLRHRAHMFLAWSRLTDVVRAGRPARLLDDPPPLQDWTVDFIAAMQQFGGRRAPAVCDLLPLEGVRRILDVGGGSGAFTAELARRCPEAEIVFFDRPEVIPLARHYLQEAGVAERVRFAAGDFLADDLGREFDLALLSHVLHSNGPAQMRDLLRRTAAALRPGGVAAIHEFLVDDGRCSPPGAALFALNMLVHTEQGDTFTEAELRGWLAEAGFAEIVRHDTGLESDLVVARRV